LNNGNLYTRKTQEVRCDGAFNFLGFLLLDESVKAENIPVKSEKSISTTTTYKR